MFLQAISSYVDQDLLIGDRPNPSINSSGNPLVLAAIAHIIAKDRKEDSIVLYDLYRGVSYLQRENGIINKKAKSSDEVTHDDIIGFISFMSNSKDKMHLSSFLSFAIGNQWILSNKDYDYWDAFAKYWDQAFYLIASGQRVDSLRHLSLVFHILFDAFFNKENSSDKQLVWIKIKTIEGKSFFVDIAAKLWRSRLKKTYGSVARLLASYHGEKHPFALYCLE